MQLSTELPGMQREIAGINSLQGREQTIKIRSIGFDELKKRIQELNNLMNDTRNPVSSDQKKEIEGMIAVYEKWQRQCVSSFDTLPDSSTVPVEPVDSSVGFSISPFAFWYSSSSSEISRTRSSASSGIPASAP